MKAPIKTEAEFAKLFAFTDQMERPAMYRFMLLVSVELGLRPMEIAGLESSWFRGEELRIPVGHSKRRSGRSLPVTPEIIAALHEHLQGRVGRVFLNASGQPFTARGISDAFRRLYRMNDIEGSCYSGRRTFATKMVDEGVSIFVVQKTLGHSHVNTTQEYVGVTDAMMRAAMFR